MYIKRVTLLLFAFTVSVSAQNNKNVLFIGNSYTYQNDLPNLVKNIAASTNDTVNHQSFTPGGATFQQHSVNANVINTIMQGNWDYVVLQEQSQLPSFPTSQFEFQSLPYAKVLADSVKNNNSCGNVLFYMTWGRKNGDAQNCGWAPYLCTYEGMDDSLASRYTKMAITNNGMLSPVGKVWRALRQSNPQIELYTGDESHPSYAGSMAAAYTFYTAIFKKDPTLTTFEGSLPAAQAAIIKQTVKEVVFDHLDDWMIRSNDKSTQFTTRNLSPNIIEFTNLTQNATDFHWDFGDGNTSTLENPTHTYAAAGNYKVSLKTNACGNGSTFANNLTVTSVHINELTQKEWNIFPNPTSDLVQINSNAEVSLVQLIDILGKVVYQGHSSVFSIAHLPNGIYTLKFKVNQEFVFHKIIKS